MRIGGYSDVSITRAGVRNDRVCDLNWGAYFKLDTDVRELFPYINQVADNARYYGRPLHVRFVHREVLCTLYPVEAMAAPFTGREHAYEFIENLVVFLNDLNERRHQLEPNHRIQREPASIVDIVKVLPRTNCKKCGFATCMAFAAALRNGETAPSECPDFVQPISICTVYPVFGPEGAIESTIRIETEAMGNDKTGAASMAKEPPVSIPAAEPAHDPEPPRYDRNGIRIQTELTAREIEVLRLLVDGATNREISEMLHISPHTVKSHIIHIFNKISASDRTQAAVWAVKNRIA